MFQLRNLFLGILCLVFIVPVEFCAQQVPATQITKRLNKYFDTTQFSFNAPFTFGNTARLMPDLFQPGIDDWSTSLFRDTKIREGITV